MLSSEFKTREVPDKFRPHSKNKLYVKTKTMTQTKSKQTDLINTLNMNGFLCINILNKDLVEYAGSSLSSDIKSGKHFLHYRLCRQLHRRLVDSLSRHTLNRISSNN